MMDLSGTSSFMFSDLALQCIYWLLLVFVRVFCFHATQLMCNSKSICAFFSGEDPLLQLLLYAML